MIEARRSRPADIEVVRKQWTVVSVETLVPGEIVGKILIEAQWLAKYLVGDVPRRQNDVQVALGDWKR